MKALPENLSRGVKYAADIKEFRVKIKKRKREEFILAWWIWKWSTQIWIPLRMWHRPDVDSSHALQNHQDMEKPCTVCCCLLTGVHLLPLCAVGPVDWKHTRMGIESASATQEAAWQNRSVLTEVCHLQCVCDATVYIHLTFITAHYWSADMSLQLWPLKKGPLKPHCDCCCQSLSAQCREGNQAFSWLLFYLNFIQNVSGIFGSGTNRPSSRPSKIHR